MANGHFFTHATNGAIVQLVKGYDEYRCEGHFVYYYPTADETNVLVTARTKERRTCTHRTNVRRYIKIKKNGDVFEYCDSLRCNIHPRWISQFPDSITQFLKVAWSSTLYMSYAPPTKTRSNARDTFSRLIVLFFLARCACALVFKICFTAARGATTSAVY